MHMKTPYIIAAIAYIAILGAGVIYIFRKVGSSEKTSDYRRKALGWVVQDRYFDSDSNIQEILPTKYQDQFLKYFPTY